MLILATRVDAIRKTELGAKLRAFFDEPRLHFIVTANPEILLQAHRDPKYRDVISAADLIVADGFGVVLAGLLRGRGVRRITGSDVLLELVTLARERQLRIQFLLPPDGLSSPADVRRLAERWGIAAEGVVLKKDDRPESAPADIVISAHGAPAQEFLLREKRAFFPNARVLVGIGGALDYATGRIRRAPLFVRRLGLEWLYRFIREPHRARRIWRAVVVFPLKVLVKTLNTNAIAK